MLELFHPTYLSYFKLPTLQLIFSIVFPASKTPEGLVATIKNMCFFWMMTNSYPP